MVLCEETLVITLHGALSRRLINAKPHGSRYVLR